MFQARWQVDECANTRILHVFAESNDRHDLVVLGIGPAQDAIRWRLGVRCYQRGDGDPREIHRACFSKASPFVDA